MKNKRAAMEMTVGTIVTIVLLMSALVLGLILTRNIFRTAQGAIDLTDQELTEQIGKAFGSDENRVAVYPKSGSLTIRQESIDAVGLGIRNLLEGVSGTQKFSYIVSVAESKCGSATNVMNWIEIGQSESNIPIAVGSYYSTKIYFRIPVGAPLCTVKYRIEVKSTTSSGTSTYDAIPFVITSKAK